MSGELAKALVAAQAAMPKVEPDAVNPHFKTKFVSLDHLIAKTRPVLNKHGLAVVQFPVSSAEEGAALRTLIVHESGETLDAGSTPLLGLGDMQKLGAAITYARRYGWASALGISADEDDDGETSVKTASKPVGGTAAQQGGGGTKPAGSAAQTPQAGPKEAELRALMADWKELKPEFDLDAALKGIDDHRGQVPAPVHVEWLGRQIDTLTKNIEAKRAESPFKAPAPKKAAA